jgi:ADP-dependent phosphofructokinase/glucokinase
MAYRDNYGQYYRQLPADIQKHKSSGLGVIMGYTSDLDVIIEWNSQTFKDIVSAFLKEEPALKPGDTIDSMESFARIVCYYMINGLGGEIDITNIEVCKFLESRFNTAFALGGTCAQGAAALNAVGFPVLVHITDRSREVCVQMSGQGLDTVTERGRVPIMESVTNAPPVRHMILQYPKGEKVDVNGTVYETPVSNRLIMDYDTVHKIMPIDKCFLDYCEANAKRMLVYSVSGFNGIIDRGIMEKRIDEVSAHYKKVKEQNPDCVIFLEGAHYLNAELKNLVLGRLSRYIDIYSMNEEELVEHTAKHGMITDKDSLSSILGGLEFMLERYPVKGMVLHTKDYSMYFGDELRRADFEKGLTLGNLMSATRARTGKYGTYSDCGESLSLPLSPSGIAFAERLKSLRTGKYVCLVPSRYMEHPKYTIGLGDTFMAGFLTSFVN